MDAHTPGIHRQYLIVDAFKVFLPFGDKLRLKVAVAIPMRLKFDLLGIGHHRFLPLPLRDLPEFLPLGSCLL